MRKRERQHKSFLAVETIERTKGEVEKTGVIVEGRINNSRSRKGEEQKEEVKKGGGGNKDMKGM